jgi:phospholipase C
MISSISEIEGSTMNSMITLQNGLSSTVTVSVGVSPVLNQSYWGNVHDGALSEQDTSLFWVSRSAGITDGQSWVFSAGTSVGNTPVILQVKLTGTLLGSDIAISVQAGAQLSDWSGNADVSLVFVAGDSNTYRISGAYIDEGAQYNNVQFTISQAILPQIKHVVVLTLENRSFDNLFGGLYDGTPGNTPACYIPNTSPPPFNGLPANSYFNENIAVNGGAQVFAREGTTAWTVGTKKVAASSVPNPDPGEEFNHVATQIGANKMDGFLTDYISWVTSAGGTPDEAAQIMQSFSPAQIPVITTLARSFAVSDAWHASVRSQTWPNRAFLQAGASAGHVNNESWPWNISTIFDVLTGQGLSWMVYNDSALPSLTKTMFFEKYGTNEANFGGIGGFQKACQAGTLPVFTFLEPSFGPYEIDESYHPPYDVTPGETFLAKIYKMIRDSPARDEILFVVLFDEHGGTYDHVVPPAAPPGFPPATDVSKFAFNQFGIRVPAIVVSSYVTAGTVFRSGTGIPYDHTSVLATLRDWLGLSAAFRAGLPSPRIVTAPTLAPVLNRPEKRDWPDIQAPASLTAAAASPAAALPSADVPLNDNQKAILMAFSAQVAKRPLSLSEKQIAGAQLQTHGDARVWLAALLPHLQGK